MAESSARTLISLPRAIRRGEVIEIKTLIAHPMETGYRPGADGVILPRDLIRTFTCHFDSGKLRVQVFSAQLFPAIAANPYLAFPMRVLDSGKLILNWRGDQGFEKTEILDLVITG